MLKGLTSTFKDGCNNVELTYKEYVKLGNDIIPVKATLKDDVYENGNFIGTFILKEIQFETEATYKFRNKEFEYYKEVDGESIKIGTFISTDITINDTTEIVKVVGMDYGLKTQVEYTSALDYASGEITLKDVWNECCTLSGLESGIDDFANSDFIVDSDQFTGTGAMIRDVFKGIAMSCGSFVKVMNDDKVYLVFNEITSEKEELEIDGSASVSNVLKIDSVNELDGNTTQSGTPTPDSPQPINVVSGRQEASVVGKNLFDNTIQPISNQGSTLVSVESINTGKKMIYNGINSVNYLWKVFTIMDLTNYVGKTIRFKCNFTASGSNIPQVNIGLCNADGSNRTSKTSTKISGNTISFIVPALVGEQKYLSVLLYINEKGTIAKDDYVDFTDMILTIDNEDMTYEPYKGQSYEINLGKNLFDISTADYVSKCTLNNEIYTTDTLIQGDRNAVFGYQANNNYTVYPNETYYLSADIKLVSGTCTGTNGFRFNTSGFTNTMIINPSFTEDYVKVLCSATNTSTAPIQAGRILFQPNNSGLSNAVFEIKNVMISKSNDTTYATYKTPIELCKINTYKDRIYKENGTWYLHKEIGKVVLNGTENWTAGAYGTNSWDLNNIIDATFNTNELQVMSSVFKGVAHKDRATSGNNIMYAIANKMIEIRNTTLTTKEQVQSATNGTPIYYILATPTTTEITDTELISQLNAIELLEGLNNISITSNDLTGKLKLTYYNNELDIIEDYVELEDKRDTHPWTCLRLGMSNIEGENVDYIDEDLVEQYGENWLILNDNPFAYNQEKRQQLIMNIFNQIKAFGYSAFVSKVAFKPYLTSGDVIHFRNREKELVKSIVLRYTHSGEQITLEAPSETSATVNYIYPLGAIDIAKQTQIIVDKDSGRIDSLTSQTQTIQDDLRENYYTSTQINELVQTAETGLTNTFSEAGGNNIFRNTGLWFATSDSSNPYEFWNGVVVKQKEEKASNMSALLLQNGNVSQEQLVPNGTYTISFKYKKLVFASTINVSINDVEYELTATEETTFNQTIEVSSQHINIKFITDVNNSGEIYDLMVNAGAVSLAYSQNQNETTTDTVNISKGIEITSSDTDVSFKANADGIRTIDRNENVLTQFTDTGMTTKTAIIESKSQIVGTLWQEVNGQTWITRL